MLTVKRQMAELGISQAEIAIHLGIDQSAVSRLFSGQRQLKVREAQRLSELLNLADMGFPATIRQIPVIGFISAGEWEKFIDRPLYMMAAPSTDLPARAFGVVVDGDSMDRIDRPRAA